MPTPEQLVTIRETLISTYAQMGLWGEARPAWPLPAEVTRGTDSHLAFLTLVYTISGGRDPVSLWQAARRTYAADLSLFDPQRLAYAKAPELIKPLHHHGLTRKPTSEATIWQRIGQALVMRADGSVQKLLANNQYDARRLLSMLGRSKTTFPILSGEQTAPRWLYGLASEGQQPLLEAASLPVPLSPTAALALEGLGIQARTVSAAVFAPLDALGRRGCQQRQPIQTLCPAARQCPVAQFCRFGHLAG